MSTCKDCIHYEPCKDSYYNAEQLSRFPLGFLEKENAEKNCAFFEDRSKFVDVSELQQNVIRPLTNRCAAYTKCLTCLACALEIRERCDHHKKAEQALKEREEE